MDENLPIFGANQQTGVTAASVLKSILLKFALINDIGQDTDIGIDFTGTLLDQMKPTIYNFNIQCKGTSDVENSISQDENYFKYSIRTSTINYWKQKPDPTFIFLVDINQGKLYWLNALNSIQNKDISDQSTVQFNIPKENCIDNTSTFISKDFKYSILTYHAEFGPRILESIKILRTGLGDIGNFSSSQTGEILTHLQSSLQDVTKETIRLLIDIMKQHFRATLTYVIQLDHMNDIVRTHYPEGIFSVKLSFGRNDKYSIDNLQDMLLKIDSSDSASLNLDEIQEMARNFEKFRLDMLYFYREMGYEDSPMFPPKQIPVEIKKFNSEKIFTKNDAYDF